MKKFMSFALTLCLILSMSAFFASAESAVTIYEAENGKLYGSSAAMSDLEGFSGTGYVGRFSSDSAYLEIPITINESGRYNITVRTNSEGNYKENILTLDGNTVGTIYSQDKKGWQDCTIEAVKIEKGNHTLAVKKSWGWIMVDYITLEKGEGISSDIYNVNYALANPNANDDAKRLWQYLCDNYGENIISGQYTDGGATSKEYKAITEGTGEAPAIWGFDMMAYSPSRVRHGEKSSAVENAIAWSKEYGGIVTFCWHWTPNEKYLGANGEPWWSGFYTNATSFDFKAAMNGQDEDGYNFITEDIDAIAVQLKRLQDAGVPVLWRPLHEASGGWFWWGTDRDSYIKLWNLVYDRLTNYHKLNNLIWVWNGQKADWYPGDDTVDIIGEDIYADKGNTSSQISGFLKAKGYTDTNKMICLSENGVIPDIENCKEDNVMWSWFGTWGGDFIQSGGKISSSNTPIETIKKVYKSNRVITLSEVPDLSTYPIIGDIEPTGDGDINSDGILDIIDVVMARAHIIGTGKLTDEQAEKGDMNSDGIIDIVDIALMRKLIVSSKA